MDNFNWETLSNIALFVNAILFFLILLLIFKKNRYLKFNQNISAEEILDQLPEHVYWKDRDGVLLGANANQWKDLGINSLEEFLGKTDYELLPKEMAETLRQTDIQIVESGNAQILEEPSIHPDGSERVFLSHKVPLRDSLQNIIGVVGVSIDITDAKRETTERLELLENIIALMPGHVYWVDRAGIYRGCNDNQAKSAGLNSRKDIVGKRNKDLPWNLPMELLPEALDKINQEVMETGEATMLEEPAILQDGTKAVFLSNKAPIRNEMGEVIGMVGISFDITKQKELEEKLQTTENKLKGMTLVASSIAHELRTPLRTIEAGAQNISNYLPPLISAYKQAKQAELEIESINPLHYQSLSESCKDIAVEARASFTMIDLLLANINFPNLKLDQPVPCSIVECVTEALKRYPLTEKERAIIHWLPEGDFIFNGDKLYVIHVLFNLLKNALYYLKASNKPDAIISIWITQNILHFKDTGTGIAAEDLPYVFDQFYSKTYHGAGVGLSFCKAAMTALKGEISCESEEGIYTEFMLKFPLA